MKLLNTMLGKYWIVQELGRGGMAIVYKAYDSTLNRYVALKVLPPELTFDPEFVRRFQQEARTAGGLSHPHIVPIYDVGTANGIHYIAMLYVEGQSLQQLLAAGRRLSASQVVSIVTQLAAALDYAHQQGVIHRDVKPSNVLIDMRGQAFLTDFGIARAAEGTRFTRAGTMVGTPEYMSPQQVRSEGIDWRTDIYSLGIVTYEMLAGRAPFKGDTARVLHDQVYAPPPPLRAINPAVPPAVEAVVAQALAKNPAERPQRAGDFAQRLAAAVQGKAISPLPLPYRSPIAGRSISPAWFAGGIAVLLFIVMIAVVILAMPRPGTLIGATPTSSPASQVTPTPTHTSVVPISSTPRPTSTNTAVPLLPTNTPPRPTATPIPPTATPVPVGLTGRVIFTDYRGGDPGNYDLVIANVDGSGRRVLIQKGSEPVISPDGLQIAFYYWQEGGIFRMNLDGSGLTRISPSIEDAYPSWSPDGQRIVFHSLRGGSRRFDIFTINLDRTDERRISDGEQPAWGPTGLIAFKGCFGGDCGLMLMNSDGSGKRLVLRDADASNPTWSPDGSQFAYVTGKDGNLEIYKLNVTSGVSTRLTDDPSPDGTPAWSRDGRSILFRSRRGDSWGIYVMNTDGSGQRRLFNSNVSEKWWWERLTYTNR